MSDASSARERGSLPRRDLLVKGGAAAAAAAVGATMIGASPAGAATLIPVLLPITPVRLYDSREASGPLYAGQTRDLVGEQTEALAFLLNVTITETVSSGFLSVFSADDTWPGTSTVNWSAPGQTIANTAYTLIRLADSGVSAYVGGPASSTQFILDLTGVLAMVDPATFNGPTGVGGGVSGPNQALTESNAG